jgi:hypothetical protein
MSGGGGTYMPGIGFVFDGMYACTPWPVKEGGMYAGCCSFGLMTLDCCGGTDGGGFPNEPDWFMPYTDPGRPPWAGGKYDPPGVAEGGGGAA